MCLALLWYETRARCSLLCVHSVVGVTWVPLFINWSLRTDSTEKNIHSITRGGYCRKERRARELCLLINDMNVNPFKMFWTFSRLWFQPNHDSFFFCHFFCCKSEKRNYFRENRKERGQENHYRNDYRQPFKRTRHNLYATVSRLWKAKVRCNFS